MKTQLSKQINLVLLHLDLLLQQLALTLLLLLTLFLIPFLSFLQFFLPLFLFLFSCKPSLVFIGLSVQSLSFLVILLGVI